MGGVIMLPHSYGNPVRRGDMNTIFIGKYCQIGDNVRFDGGWTHNHENISTYPFHAWGITDRWPNNNICKGDIIVGNDCWLCEDVIIMSGVTIGDGAIIGAASIITKDVEPYSVMGGVNKLIRKRFSEEDIVKLLELKWWDLPDDAVTSIVPLLHGGDVDALISALRQ